MKPALKTSSREKKTFKIIAEIGVNHEGDFALACRLIDLAREGGADAAKFQTYKAEKLAVKNSPAYWDTTKEPTTSQYDLFKKYDRFDVGDYRKLAAYCEKAGIEFMSTPFDLESVDFIDPLVETHKIASADLTNLPLLRKIASKGKPVLLSTGAASLLEIERAIRELKAHGADPVTLLHCVLNYPTPVEKAHLSRLFTLKSMFPRCAIGYSDHTMPGDSCLPVVLACAMGATVIEKHFTHDKTLPGNDHYHAMDVADLRKLRGKLDELTLLLGPGQEETFLADQLAAIKHARRSIVSSRPIARGTRIAASDLTVKRPASGISPLHWDEVIGMQAVSDIPADTPVQWPDLAP